MANTDRFYGTPLPPAARRRLRALSGGRRMPSPRRTPVLVIGGSLAAAALLFGALLLSFSEPAAEVVPGGTEYELWTLGRVSFERPLGWLGSISDPDFNGPLIFIPPVPQDPARPPAAMRMDSTIADPALLESCGVPAYDDAVATPTPDKNAVARDPMPCLTMKLLGTGIGRGGLLAPDVRDQTEGVECPYCSSFTYAARTTDTGVSRSAVELRWTENQVPWAPAGGVPTPTPRASFEGTEIPEELIGTARGPTAEYPKIGRIAITDTDPPMRFEMDHLVALYLPARGTLPGPRGTRRFFVIGISYPKDSAPELIREYRRVFERVTRSVAFGVTA